LKDVNSLGFAMLLLLEIADVFV